MGVPWNIARGHTRRRGGIIRQSGRHFSLEDRVREYGPRLTFFSGTSRRSGTTTVQAMDATQ